MANALYNKGRQAFMEGDLDLSSLDIRVILIDAADYTVNLATHDFLNDVAGAARVAVSDQLTGVVTTDGIFDADDVTFAAVVGDPCEAFIIYNHTGTESDSHLIAYFDTATGLPVTPNGGNITIQWDNGANKIFKL